MTASPEPLSLRRIYGRTFRALWRDAPLIAAIMLPLCGAGVVGSVWLSTWLHGEIAAHPAGAVMPWLAETLLDAVADAGVVWVALRRLGGGRGPALGGLAGALRVIGVVIAIDILEGATGLVELLVPDSLSNPAQPFYDLAVILIDALWTALWLPAVAVAVSQRTGGPTSLGRGLGLALGHLRVLVVFALTIELAARITFDVARLGLAAAGLGEAPDWPIAFLILPIGAFAAVSQAVVYWDLTRLKTGLTAAGAADVFS